MDGQIRVGGSGSISRWAKGAHVEGGQSLGSVVSIIGSELRRLKDVRTFWIAMVVCAALVDKSLYYDVDDVSSICVLGLVWCQEV